MTAMPSPSLELRNPDDRLALAEEAVALHHDDNPALAQRYGPAGRAKCVQDAAYHLAYLDETVASGAPALFLAYLDWVRSQRELAILIVEPGRIRIHAEEK